MTKKLWKMEKRISNNVTLHDNKKVNLKKDSVVPCILAYSFQQKICQRHLSLIKMWNKMHLFLLILLI